MSRGTIALDRLTHLATLFKAFSNGRHVNRLAEPALWAELEQEEDSYRDLFAALGYELRMDGRGFAWFHMEEASSKVNRATRQLALLFMAIFDTQADAGRGLLRFGDWVIDRELLDQVHEQHEDLFTAEQLDRTGLAALMETAERFGFARTEGGHWQLLPAVCRYLDHYEALAAADEDAVVVGDLSADEDGDDAEEAP